MEAVTVWPGISGASMIFMATKALLCAKAKFRPAKVARISALGGRKSLETMEVVRRLAVL